MAQPDPAEELANQIGDALNHFGSSNRWVRSLVIRLSCQHRSIQQLFTVVCVAWLEDLASRYGEGRYDARNEASCQLGKVFVENIGEDDRCLPLI